MHVAQRERERYALATMGGDTAVPSMQLRKEAGDKESRLDQGMTWKANR